MSSLVLYVNAVIAIGQVSRFFSKSIASVDCRQFSSRRVQARRAHLPFRRRHIQAAKVESSLTARPLVRRNSMGRLEGNSSTDISRLGNLANLPRLVASEKDSYTLPDLSSRSMLSVLDLSHNHISDPGPLSTRSQVTFLRSRCNPIESLAPLVPNETVGDGVSFSFCEGDLTCAPAQAEVDLAALPDRGVEISNYCD